MLQARRSIRLPEYDYSQPGKYFITLVTHHREPIFGQINSTGRIEMSQCGLITHHEWMRFLQDFQIEPDEYMVMPNHFHAILTLSGTPAPAKNQKSGPQPGSVGMLIGQYKSRVTRRIRSRLSDPEFVVWHRNYYEHIIRTDRALEKIRQYITENPLQWANDKFYTSQQIVIHKDAL